MIIIKKYEDYKRALEEGRDVMSWNTYLGHRMMRETDDNSFVVINIDRGTYDILYYEIYSGLPNLSNAICHRKHHISEVLPDNILDNYYKLSQWCELFCQKPDDQKYHFNQGKYGKQPIIALPAPDFDTLLLQLSDVIQQWEIVSAIKKITGEEDLRPRLVFITGQWSFCAPVSYICQSFLVKFPTKIIPLSYEGEVPHIQSGFWPNKSIADQRLLIGQGVPLTSLFSRSLRLSLPLSCLSSTAMNGVNWEVLTGPDLLPDYSLGGQSYAEVTVSAGSDSDGNIWLESIPLQHSREPLTHRYFFNSANERFPLIGDDIESIRSRRDDFVARANGGIESLVQDIKANKYTNSELRKYKGRDRLEQLKQEIDNLLDFDYVVTDTNVWCTSKGWDKPANSKNINSEDPNTKPYPVLLFRDLIWTFANMLGQKGRKLEIEGHCFREIEKKANPQSKNLREAESFKQAKLDILRLHEANLLAIPNMPPEKTPQEIDAECKIYGGRDKIPRDTYADSHIRCYMQSLYRDGKRVMIITRDRTLRLRLVAQYEEDILNKIDDLEDFMVPCVISPDDCLLIFQTRALIISIIDERGGEPVPHYDMWWNKVRQDGLIHPLPLYSYSENNTQPHSIPLPCNNHPFKNIDELSNEQMVEKYDEIKTILLQYKYIITDADFWLDIRKNKMGNTLLCNWTNNIIPTLEFLHRNGSFGFLSQDDFEVVSNAQSPQADKACLNVKELKNKGALVIKSFDEITGDILSLEDPEHSILFFCKHRAVYDSLLQALAKRNPQKQTLKFSSNLYIKDLDFQRYNSLSKMMNQFFTLSHQLE